MKTAKLQNMKRRSSILKDYVRVAGPGAAIMTLLVGFPVLSSILFGIFRLIPIPLFAPYVWQVATIAIAAGLLWCVYRILGVRRSLETAAMVAVVCSAVYWVIWWTAIHPALMFAVSFVAACAAFFLVQRIKRASVIWGIIAVLAIFTIFAAHLVGSYFANVQYQNKTEERLQEARIQLNFDAYVPQYVPDGMKLTPPELFGINSRINRLYVEYSISGIEVKQAAKLNDQDLLMNFTNNCDIRTLWSAMTDQDGVTSRDVERSRSNLSKCVLIATTENGRKIYFQQGGQWTRFYTELGNTNVIFEFDEGNRTDYEESFLPEIVKIINSLEPVAKDKIEYGRH